MNKNYNFSKPIKETAIEIGKSCKLIQENMDLLILSSKTKEEFLRKLKKKCLEYVKKFNFILQFENIRMCPLILESRHFIN